MTAQRFYTPALEEASVGGAVPAPAREARSGEAAPLLRRGLLLEYLTLGWNVVGSGVLLWAAVVARSVALAGFGLDSLIEIAASLVVVWHLKDVEAARRERRALRIIGIPFLLLATYIAGSHWPPASWRPDGSSGTACSGQKRA